MKDLARTPLKLYKRPRLKGPRLVVAWGRIGKVGIDSATYLKDKVVAKEFAEIEPYDFFDVSTSVKAGLVERPQFPQGKFYYWKNRKGDDLIICITDHEPLKLRYEYAGLILDLAQQLKVEKLYSICAFPSTIHHDEEPKVFGVVNSAKLIRYIKQHDVILLGQKSLTSMNALLLSLARKRNIPGVYLLGEVPSYTTEIANPKSCRAVLRVLTAMLGLYIDMTGMDESARQAEVEIDRRVRAASSEFIDRFTVDYRDLFEEGEDQE